MTLRRKTVIILIITFVCLTTLLYIASYLILNKSYLELEEQDTRKNIERVLNALDVSIGKVDTLLKDYSNWDDLCDFVHDKNQEFIDSNFTDTTFINGEINFVVIFDNSGNLVYKKGFDLVKKVDLPVPDSLMKFILDKGANFRASEDKSSKVGIINLPENPLFVSLRPVLDSRGDGPSQGIMMMGRYMSKDVIDELSENTGLSIKAERYDNQSAEPDFMTARPYLTNKSVEYIRPLSNDVIAGYVLINDIYGNPSHILRTDIEREIFKQGRTSLLFFLGFMVIVGILITVILLLFLEKTLLSRLLQLNESVKNIGEWGDSSKRVEIKGNDELNSLSDSINGMLESIEKSEKVIKKQAYTDFLTNLYNRTFFEEEMARLSKNISFFKPLSIVSIDVDGLKIVNDTLGHKQGDEMLRNAAQIISTAFRNIDTVARIGGDEFGVILPNSEFSIAKTKREKIIELVEEFNSKDPMVPISMSVGIATSSNDLDESIFDVFKRADDDMYQYKFSQKDSTKSKVIDLLQTALSERDYVAQGHVERLVKMSELMAEKLNLPDPRKRNLILLARMHDLGKIGIPDEILHKSGELTKEEYEKMKKHSEIGYNIANRSLELSNIANLVLHHHEFWNGNGYPDGLKGEEIPLECRILSIIDSYDAMVSERPYHKGISKEEAIKIIRDCAGTQFDPNLTEKFISVIENE